VVWAARGDSGIRTAVVRPANTFGIRMTARIASCGPSPAALLVLD
jgi:nucleoside-diphosphate-sugar epimerase